MPPEPVNPQYVFEAVEAQRNAVMNELAAQQAVNRSQAERIAALEKENADLKAKDGSVGA
jgi:hypothetical protein